MLKKLIRMRLAGSQAPADAGAAAAQRLRAMFPVDEWLAKRPPRPAAVLVGLIERGEDLGILLTRRTETLADHAGQISFPGGRLEESDEGPLEAALREAEEEIGLARAWVEPVGYLPPHLTLTGYSVVPVVGLVGGNPKLTPDPKEVAELFELPLSFLMNTANHALETREVSGLLLPLPVFHYEGRRIWGATAFMLQDLYQALAGSPPGDPR